MGFLDSMKGFFGLNSGRSSSVNLGSDDPLSGNPPDFSSFDSPNDLGGGSFGQVGGGVGSEQSPIDSSLNNRDPDALLGSRSQNSGLGSSNDVTVRTSPSATVLPGHSLNERDSLTGDSDVFNHDLFSSANGSSQNQAPGSSSSVNNSNRSLNNQQSMAGSDSSQGGVLYQEISHRQAELILERLDTVKAELDAIKQRLRHIELVLDRQQKGSQRRYL